MMETEKEIAFLTNKLEEVNKKMLLAATFGEREKAFYLKLIKKETENRIKELSKK